MNIQIASNQQKKHEELLKRHLLNRISLKTDKNEMEIELNICKTLEAEESYTIQRTERGFRIIGSDELGLSYGIGKFLHSAKWTEDTFVPNPPTKCMTPSSSFRAIYFAVHFNNWYDEAPKEELEHYVEELLLYGYNTIICIVPIVSIKSFEDEFFVRAVEKTRTMFELAKKYGMKVGIIINVNQGMKNAPKEYDADLSYEQDPNNIVRGTLGRNLCPTAPGMIEYMRNIWNTQFEQYIDIGLDYILTWPYDEGGCGCEKCRPWGAKGYSNLVNAVHEDAVTYYPNAKFIVSTWCFDEPGDEGEYAGLYERLKSDMSYVDYIMVDSHDQFPSYPLNHEVVKPIVNFPEISMWELYPWGGRGANPMPKRFQQIWDSAKHVLQGGMPYSEGMYEDILKVQIIGYYWEPDKKYQEILGEYINYEYSSDVIEDVLKIMELIEENHICMAKKIHPNLETAIRAEELATKVDGKLSDRAKNSWRWRILYIRTKIDRKVYEYHMKNCVGTKDEWYNLYRTQEWYLKDDQEAQNLMQELCYYYHCIDTNPENHNRATHPPVIGGKVISYSENRRK